MKSYHLYIFFAILFLAACNNPTPEPIPEPQPEIPKKDSVEGMLSGKFSVSSNKQVRFSKGNLQYKASSRTWQFAENQWDIIGEDNQYISNTYNGWIDLFGWGTGENPTLKSTKHSDYPITFRDWGANRITNGDNRANLWRTMTVYESNYMCFNRLNADSLRGFATVNGVLGIVLLPDDWIKPQDVAFIPDTKDFETNTYSIEEWQVMEKNGAVFLPNAGEREGNVVSIETISLYWSSTINNVNEYAINYAYTLRFIYKDGWLNMWRHTGIAVRLVLDVEFE